MHVRAFFFSKSAWPSPASAEWDDAEIGPSGEETGSGLDFMLGCYLLSFLCH